MFFGESDAVII